MSIVSSMFTISALLFVAFSGDLLPSCSCRISRDDKTQFRCDYKYFPDAEGWVKLHRLPSNLSVARLRCNLEGSNLASPSKTSLQIAMKTLINEAEPNMDCGVLTGIHGLFSKGDFQTIEGVPLWQISHTWAPGEPDDYKGQEDCIALLPDGNFADVDCNDPLPYMCYKKQTHDMVMSKCGTTDEEYTYEPSTGSCYKLHTSTRTWSQAYMTCSAEGGHLIVVNNEQEAKIVQNIFAKHPERKLRGIPYKDVAFMGLYDWNKHREWMTIHGDTLAKGGYANWAYGEPNNKNINEYCGTTTPTGHMNDVSCGDKYMFICEKNPNSLLCDTNTALLS